MAQWYHVISVIEREAGEGSRKVVTGWAIKGQDNEQITRKYDTRHLSKREVVQKAKDRATPYHPGVVIRNNNRRIVDIWVNSEYTTGPRKRLLGAKTETDAQDIRRLLRCSEKSSQYCSQYCS